MIPSPVFDYIEKLEICENFVLEEGFSPGNVYIESRLNRQKRKTYAVMYHGNCMLKNGKFEMEPSPSSRGDEFLKRARFDSMSEAYETFIKYHKGESV